MHATSHRSELMAIETIAAVVVQPRQTPAAALFNFIFFEIYLHKFISKDTPRPNSIYPIHTRYVVMLYVLYRITADVIQTHILIFMTSVLHTTYMCRAWRSISFILSPFYVRENENDKNDNNSMVKNHECLCTNDDDILGRLPYSLPFVRKNFTHFLFSCFLTTQQQQQNYDKNRDCQ